MGVKYQKSPELSEQPSIHPEASSFPPERVEVPIVDESFLLVYGLPQDYRRLVVIKGLKAHAAVYNHYAYRVVYESRKVRVVDVKDPVADAEFLRGLLYEVRIVPVGSVPGMVFEEEVGPIWGVPREGADNLSYEVLNISVGGMY